MPHELVAALCLVPVIEGLLLLVAPRRWQEMMREASRWSPGVLRACGAVAIALGLLALQWLR